MSCEMTHQVEFNGWSMKVIRAGKSGGEPPYIPMDAQPGDLVPDGDVLWQLLAPEFGCVDCKATFYRADEKEKGQ